MTTVAHRADICEHEVEARPVAQYAETVTQDML